MNDDVLISVKNLKKYFPVKGGVIPHKIADIQAVDDISFEIHEGETVGLAGESGCGKTTTARCIALLERNIKGKMFYKGKNILEMKGKESRDYRENIGMIFQDPFRSLNPRLPIVNIVGEPLDVHRNIKGRRKEVVVGKLLEEVGLDPTHIYRWPSEFSGGQKQRIAIARALALRPKLVLADEPVSSVDLSIRSSIMHLLEDLQEKYNLSYLFITHDLSALKYIADRLIIMYLGQFVEKGRTEEIFKEPLHPYTKALISAIPIPDPTVEMNPIILKGSVPSPRNPPSGCPFHPRCPEVMDICAKKEPKLQEVEDGRYVACHLYSG